MLTYAFILTGSQVQEVLVVRKDLQVMELLNLVELEVPLLYVILILSW